MDGDADPPADRPPSGSPDAPADDETAFFEQAMAGVTPIARQGRRSASPPPRRKPRDPERPEPRRPVQFELERVGDTVSGRREGVEPSVIGRLREGAWEVELRVELHGFPEHEARGEVRDAVERAFRGGLRCVLLVHGKGLRSAGGPVLKEAVPRWLTRGPLARRVVAFTSAPARQGGAGATLVLLRKRRAPSPPSGG